MSRQGVRQGTSYGMALRAAAALSFSLMYALMKWAATLEPVSAGEMVFYRSLFGLPVVLFWVQSAKGGLASLSTRRPMVHVWRCALGVTGILLIFQGLKLLPLADATTIGFTAPIFATLLSILFLKEKVGRHRWTAVVLGFLGVLVMVRPGAEGAPPLAGLLFALGGAFVAAAVTVTLRQLGKTESATAIVFWFFVACATVGGVLTLIDGHSHSWAVLAVLAAGGLAGGLAQLLMTTSLQHAPVSALAPLDYLQMVGAVVLGWLLLSDAPTAATLAGAALIVGSGLYTAWRERVLHREITPPSPNASV
ncbi:DMT family transporter [Brevundimonas sp. P7753]|uniref:DMT family transporter n=1 Tax=Brevundimonas sp. P7753 TaxID=2726982 RepID=UPI0015C0BBAE|nr:DMT family transporter [Brevundimonas sp. P7753]NWE51716.1 DMT family transporter [Brevundimonas sp. P7753]